MDGLDEFRSGGSNEEIVEWDADKFIHIQKEVILILIIFYQLILLVISWI